MNHPQISQIDADGRRFSLNLRIILFLSHLFFG
jgi:hypothetical protein